MAETTRRTLRIDDQRWDCYKTAAAARGISVTDLMIIATDQLITASQGRIDELAWRHQLGDAA